MECPETRSLLAHLRMCAHASCQWMLSDWIQWTSECMRCASRAKSKKTMHYAYIHDDDCEEWKTTKILSMSERMQKTRPAIHCPSTTVSAENETEIGFWMMAEWRNPSRNTMIKTKTTTVTQKKKKKIKKKKLWCQEWGTSGEWAHTQSLCWMYLLYLYVNQIGGKRNYIDRKKSVCGQKNMFTFLSV